MSAPVRVKGASGHGLDVTVAGSARVSSVPRPPSDWTRAQVAQRRVLSTYFANGGDPDMTVDGSTTPQEFEVTQRAGYIRWISSIRVTHAASGMNAATATELRDFGGAGAALSNGLILTASQDGMDTPLLTEDGVKSTAEFYQYNQDLVILVGAYDTNIDYLFATIQLPVPVGLYPGSADRLFFTVQDDLSGSTVLTALAEGWEERIL